MKPEKIMRHTITSITTKGSHNCVNDIKLLATQTSDIAINFLQGVIFTFWHFVEPWTPFKRSNAIKRIKNKELVKVIPAVITQYLRRSLKETEKCPIFTMDTTNIPNEKMRSAQDRLIL